MPLMEANNEKNFDPKINSRALKNNIDKMTPQHIKLIQIIVIYTEEKGTNN